MSGGNTLDNSSDNAKNDANATNHSNSGSPNTNPHNSSDNDTSEAKNYANASDRSNSSSGTNTPIVGGIGIGLDNFLYCVK